MAGLCVSDKHKDSTIHLCVCHIDWQELFFQKFIMLFET